MCKVIIITGGANGIGKELVTSFLASENIVISIDNQVNYNSKLINNKKFHYYKFDLNNYKLIPKLYKNIKKKYFTVDVLINNARSKNKKNFLSEDFLSWEKTFNINLHSHFFLSKQLLLNKNNLKKKSYIINLSSISGKLITSQSPSYNITKASLVHMSKYLASMSKSFNITSNCILPGLIIQKRHLKKFNSKKNKKFRDKSNFSINNSQIGTEIDIFNTINYIISGKADYLNGAEIILDGGSSINEQLDILLRYK
jgi:NAD(P)-dependent dehydrogenase (short-subunit alcohol dehydrogenase family)